MRFALPSISTFTTTPGTMVKGEPRKLGTYRAARRQLAKVVRALSKPDRKEVQPTLPVSVRKRLPAYLEKNMPRDSVPGGVRRRLALSDKFTEHQPNYVENLLSLRKVGRRLGAATDKMLDIILARKGS